MESIVEDIEKKLVEKNFLVWPVVKFSPGILLRDASLLSTLFIDQNVIIV